MNKKVKKSLIITGSVVGGFVALFLLIYLILALIGCGLYGEARKTREYVCDIAGISAGIAPQGITYSKEKDVYIQTGYDKNSATLLYIVEKGKARRVFLYGEDGTTLKGHAGGITCVQDCVYIANGSKLYMFSLNEMYGAGTTAVQVKRVICVDNNAAYCYNDDTHLYVGEFYREQNYKTDALHHYTTPNGAQNKAIVSAYSIDADGQLIAEGEQPYPQFRISLPEFVQGFAVHNGVYMLSRSYGLIDSALDYHAQPKDSGQTQTVTFKANPDAATAQVPLYYLDSSTLFKTLTLPSFSEDITVVNGRVVVTNEASANKYFIGKLFGAHKVFSYPIFELTEQN